MVDPTTIALIERFESVGRELSRLDPLTLTRRLRQRGQRLREARLGDHPAEDDHGE